MTDKSSDENALAFLITKDRKKVEQSVINVMPGKKKNKCTKCGSDEWKTVYVDELTQLITYCDDCPHHNNKEYLN